MEKNICLWNSQEGRNHYKTANSHCCRWLLEHYCTGCVTDGLWDASYSSFLSQTSFCLIMLASEWKTGGREWVREGRTDGGQVVGTDNSAQGTHKHTYTNVLSNAACTWNTSSIYDCLSYLWTQALCMCKCVCESKAQLVSGNLCTGKHSNASIPCGKPTTCWSIKGESPGEQRKMQNFGWKFLFLLPIKKCVLLTLPLKNRKKKHLVYYLLITLIFFYLKKKEKKMDTELESPFQININIGPLFTHL